MKRALIFLLALSPVLLATPTRPQISLPPGARWLDHLNAELLPFWTTPAAFGTPFGAFPATRCDDGTLYHKESPCPEIERNPWISPQQRHLVALSRQTYGYGIAFHLTGKREYLEVMKAGIDFIRGNAMDRANGGMARTQNIADGRWGPSPELRTPQELGYGLLGMALYYYLTRDAEVLQDILTVKRYIFDQYYDPSLATMQWLPKSARAGRTKDNKLVAQLDQMNTYLVLLTPLLPEPTRGEWKESLLQLGRAMIDQFYSPAERLFFLSSNRSEDRKMAAAGTDFGHNAKALWMIRSAGRITEHADLVAFAEDNARALLSRAYLDDCGCWAQGLHRGGALDVDKSWWIYAELDQLAGSLALADQAFAQYLPRAYAYWFSHFVDPVYGEVWNSVDGKTHTPIRKLSKQWPWKNAYHSFEHALVGYIVGQQLHREPVTLYYALPSNSRMASVHPYFFSGTIDAVETMTDDRGRQSQKVTFSNVY